jgi:hypothetical protein
VVHPILHQCCFQSFLRNWREWRRRQWIVSNFKKLHTLKVQSQIFRKWRKIL